LTKERDILTKYGVWKGKIIGLCEGEFSYRAGTAHVQLNSITVRRGWKQWTEKNRTARKSKSEIPKGVMTTRNDRHLVRMALMNRTAASTQFAACLSAATITVCSANSSMTSAPWTSF